MRPGERKVTVLRQFNAESAYWLVRSAPCASGASAASPFHREVYGSPGACFTGGGLAVESAGFLPYAALTWVLSTFATRTDFARPRNLRILI